MDEIGSVITMMTVMNTGEQASRRARIRVSLVVEVGTVKKEDTMRTMVILEERVRRLIDTSMTKRGGKDKIETAIVKGIGIGTEIEVESTEKADDLEMASCIARDLPQHLQGVIGTLIENRIGKGID